MKNKRGITQDVLMWYILAAFVLICVLTWYFIVKDKSVGALDFIKNLFRFGGA